MVFAQSQVEAQDIPCPVVADAQELPMAVKPCQNLRSLFMAARIQRILWWTKVFQYTALDKNCGDKVNTIHANATDAGMRNKWRAEPTSGNHLKLCDPFYGVEIEV